MKFEFESFIKISLFAFVMAFFSGCSWFKSGDRSDGPKNMVLITSKAELEKYLKEYKNVMVDFFAPWCSPCKKVMPILKDLAVEYSDKSFAVLKANIDNARALADEFKVRGVPTFVYFKDGKQVHQHTEIIEKDVFKANLKVYFGI